MRVQNFIRGIERKGPLPLGTKLAQATGAFPGLVMEWTFATFLLLFYNQVLGMPASWASAALTVAVILDAFIDLGIGSFSDGLMTRIGRRHPLMYASIIPLALTLWALFSPPAGLGNGGMFAWLLVFAVTSRIALSLFMIPWEALFPELTNNYVERSQILAYRWSLGVATMAAFQAISWSLIFKEQGGQVGQLVRSNYYTYAFVLAAVVAGGASLTTLLTHREIPFLRQPAKAGRFTPVTILRDLQEALTCRNFVFLFAALLISNAITGTLNALRLYTYTYFWGLGPIALKYFALAGLGAFVALFTIPWITRRFEKRDVVMAGVVLNLLNNTAIVSLRFLDLLPPNGDPRLVAILVGNEIFHYFLLVTISTMFLSMVADTIDEQELRTGGRQEGVFSAAIQFSGKAISGVGVLAAGLIVEFYVGLAGGATAKSVSPEVVRRIGIVMGYALPLLYFIPVAIIFFYSLSRARHADVLQAIAQRGSAGRPQGIALDGAPALTDTPPV